MVQSELSWQEPLRARLWDVQFALKRFLRWPINIVSIVIILELVCVVIVHFVDSTQLPRVIPLFLDFPIALLAVAVVLLVVFVCGAFCVPLTLCISSEGLRAGSSSQDRTIGWSEVAEYQIVDHPKIAGLRSLEFKDNRFDRWRKWTFDPAEVDEQRIVTLMNANVPRPAPEPARDIGALMSRSEFLTRRSQYSRACNRALIPGFAAALACFIFGIAEANAHLDWSSSAAPVVVIALMVGLLVGIILVGRLAIPVAKKWNYRCPNCNKPLFSNPRAVIMSKGQCAYCGGRVFEPEENG